MAVNYADELQGKNVYQLKNKTIIYEPVKKQAYILTDEKLTTYKRLNYRTIIAILITAIGIFFINNVWLSLLMGVAFYLITSYQYYFNFLKGLNQFEGFTREKYAEYQAYTSNPARRIIMIMALVLIAILVVEYFIVK